MMTDQKEMLKKHQNDTGSAEVQIAALTADITRLTAHIAVNKKDYSGLRGLLQKVADRKTFLKYLKRTDEAAYKKVTETLGLKK